METFNQTLARVQIGPQLKRLLAELENYHVRYTDLLAMHCNTTTQEINLRACKLSLIVLMDICSQRILQVITEFFNNVEGK